MYCRGICGERGGGNVKAHKKYLSGWDLTCGANPIISRFKASNENMINMVASKSPCGLLAPARILYNCTNRKQMLSLENLHSLREVYAATYQHPKEPNADVDDTINRGKIEIRDNQAKHDIVQGEPLRKNA